MHACNYIHYKHIYGSNGLKINEAIFLFLTLLVQFKMLNSVII